MFIFQLIIKNDPTMLIRAKFVEKWLAKQKWGDKDEERQANFSNYLNSHQNRMTEICRRLQETRLGWETLEKNKLLSPGQPTPASDQGSRYVVFSATLTNDDREADVQSVEGLQPRVLEQSAEEQRLRRQHRHAMVLNDGTRPLNRNDIIERDHD